MLVSQVWVGYMLSADEQAPHGRVSFPQSVRDPPAERSTARVCWNGTQQNSLYRVAILTKKYLYCLGGRAFWIERRGIQVV